MNSIVSALFYSPIKSARGIWILKKGDSLEVMERGFRYDRQWLVVEGNMFVAQRQGSLPVSLPTSVKNALTPFGLGIEVRTMCKVAPWLEGEELVIAAPEMGELRLPTRGVSGPEEMVTVWRDRELTAVDQGKEASAWFTRFLSRERPGNYRLMRMADGCRRKSKGGDTLQGFHDGFPFMMISEESLGNLNRLLGLKGKQAVPMNRFRPNVVISGVREHGEDRFSHVRIGDVTFEGKTLCDRCVVTCTDQSTAERGKEPLATLATYRRGANLKIKEKPNAVFFGRNFDHKNTGTVSVGDEIILLSDNE